LSTTGWQFIIFIQISTNTEIPARISARYHAIEVIFDTEVSGTKVHLPR
jgi:hypothetical protein